jgi:hypothetical protein
MVASRNIKKKKKTVCIFHAATDRRRDEIIEIMK